MTLTWVEAKAVVPPQGCLEGVFWAGSRGGAWAEPASVGEGGAGLDLPQGNLEVVRTGEVLSPPHPNLWPFSDSSPGASGSANLQTWLQAWTRLLQSTPPPRFSLCPVPSLGHPWLHPFAYLPHEVPRPFLFLGGCTPSTTMVHFPMGFKPHPLLYKVPPPT